MSSYAVTQDAALHWLCVVRRIKYKIAVLTFNVSNTSTPACLHLYTDVKQESRAVARNYRAMQDTCTESLHLILGQRSE